MVITTAIFSKRAPGLAKDAEAPDSYREKDMRNRPKIRSF